MRQPVGIVGSGGFGQGLALAAARVGRRVVLWSRTRRDPPSDGVQPTTQLADVAQCELVFMAVPSSHVSSVADRLGAHLDGSHLLVHVSRGLVGEELRTLSQVLRERTPVRRVGALAGPLVARALADGAPGGGIVGSVFPEVAGAVRDAIAGPAMRIYETDDVIGVEVASAMVGLIALAIGYAQGIGLGPGTLAVMATRGVFEAARIGISKDATDRTFAGLAGFGDLIAAVAGDDRPELTLGRGLAGGLGLDQAATRAGAHVEGTAIAERVTAYARRRGLDAPLSSVVSDVLAGRIDGRAAVDRLMARPTRRE